MSQIRLLYYEFVNVDYLCVKNGNEDMKRDNDQPVVCNKINWTMLLVYKATKQKTEQSSSKWMNVFRTKVTES